MSEFEALLQTDLPALERFVKFRIGNPQDAEDVLQEVCLAAYKGFDTLKDKSSFKAWLIGVARNKCSDYFREKAKRMELPLDALRESVLTVGLRGVSTGTAVRDTLERLGGPDQQILYLYYFKDLPQAEIAARLGIPLGTVKSRLHNAKARFREQYPYKQKGENIMKKLPDILPEYKITKLDGEPFPVCWEEMMGWFLVPKLGEKLSWAIYDLPGRKRSEQYDMAVVGRAEVHGIQGVEIRAVEHGDKKNERSFVAQLTDTHCRILAESSCEDGVRKLYTFLDGSEFLDNWGFGEDNCGKPLHLAPKGDILRSGDAVTTAQKQFLLDLVGRYEVEIGGKRFDTVCLMDVETYDEGVATEQFLDRNGRTVLWRRFNRDDWAFDSYGKRWSELLPENERLSINGQVFVHWYDCITDYIL